MSFHRQRLIQSSNLSPTIRDVARLASVSIATVSRTLSSPEKVRPETRERVLSAVLSCNYKPNEYAQRLGRLRGEADGLDT
jgi:LacI family transcriptional regulator